MPIKKVNTPRAAAGSSISSLLRSSHSKTLTSDNATGAVAAERGSQPRAAARPPDASVPPITPNHSVDRYRKALQDIATIETALGTRDDVASVSPTLLHEILDLAKVAFDRLIRNSKEQPSIQNILEEIQAVHATVRSLPTPPSSPRASYAQIAANSLPHLPPSPPRSSLPSETCEITVRLADPSDRQAIAATPNEAIIQKINQAHPDGKAVVAVRKLPSGDIRVFLANEAARKALLTDPTWTKILGQSSSATEQLFQVAVHSVRVDSVDPTKAADIIALQEQNQTLHPGLRIARAKWMKPRHGAGQVHGSLVLGLPDAQMADRVIQRGLVSSFTLHMAEYHSPSFRITQCFKCQGYGHIAMSCRNAVMCGHCAGSHQSQECTQTDDPRCANCGRRHAAWGRECKARMTAKTRSMQARHAAPSLHSQATNVQYEPNGKGQSFEWRTVGIRKRKHSPAGDERRRPGPGRPPAVQTPNPSSQRRLSLARMPSTSAEPPLEDQASESMIEDE